MTRRPELEAARQWLRQATVDQQVQTDRFTVTDTCGVSSSSYACNQQAANDPPNKRHCLGAHDSKSMPRKRSPFKIANRPPKSLSAPISAHEVEHIARLRHWLCGLKGGTVEWPDGVMHSAPADFASCWSDGVGLCLLAGALEPLAGRTLLGWERRPKTRAQRAHNVRRALSVLALQAKMHLQIVPLLFDTRSSMDGSSNYPLLQTSIGGSGAGTLRGTQALMCDEAILQGCPVIILALLRLVRMAYRPP